MESEAQPTKADKKSFPGTVEPLKIRGTLSNKGGEKLLEMVSGEGTLEKKRKAVEALVEWEAMLATLELPDHSGHPSRSHGRRVTGVMAMSKRVQHGIILERGLKP